VACEPLRGRRFANNDLAERCPQVGANYPERLVRWIHQEVTREMAMVHWLQWGVCEVCWSVIAQLPSSISPYSRWVPILNEPRIISHLSFTPFGLHVTPMLFHSTEMPYEYCGTGTWRLRVMELLIRLCFPCPGTVLVLRPNILLSTLFSSVYILP
jgi:hypothetical protein